MLLKGFPHYEIIITFFFYEVVTVLLTEFLMKLRRKKPER